MKIHVELGGKTLQNFMRHIGYAPEISRTSDQLRFHRLIAGRPYPKFHIYCSLSDDKKSATLNLHLDQRAPSYKGTHAHSGEYDGDLIETEAARIQSK